MAQRTAVGWTCAAIPFGEWSHAGSLILMGPLAVVSYQVGLDGSFSGKKPVIAEPKDGGLNPQASLDQVAPLLLSICFMHCKNVVAVEGRHPRNPARAWERKHGIPLTTFHTLDIHPMRKKLAIEGNSEIDGARKALHVCRGHFKDYRDGRGLFGQHKGLFWWEDALRGSADQGVSDKRYVVHPR